MKEYRRITRGRRAGQVASPWRKGVRPECIHEYGIAELLNVVYDYYDLRPIIDENAVRKAYTEIAGEMISKLTKSVSFKDGVLTLKFDTATLRQEVFYRRSSLMEKINEKLPEPIVKEINVY